MAVAEESSNRMQNLRRAFVKAVDRSFPSSANHFQLSLNGSDSTAKELLGTMIPDPKSQAGRTTLHVLADLYAQSTNAIKKVSEVRILRACVVPFGGLLELVLECLVCHLLLCSCAQ